MAQNINLSAIYLGRFADIDTFEGNYAAENEQSLLGTYGSASDPLSRNVVTIDSDSPTQWIDTNQDTGNGALTYDTGQGVTTTKLDSMITFRSVVRFTDGTATKLELDVIQTLNGDVFAIAWDNSAILGSKPIQQIMLGEVSYDRWAGFSQAGYDSVTFVCYAAGTSILTDQGEVPVEKLSAGDRVITLDRGPAEVRWVRASTQPLDPAEEDDKPVLIGAGALGPGVPGCDLVVSPQHRILVGGQRQLSDVFPAEVFVPAKALTSLRRIRHMKGKREVTWVHFACDRHEVVKANGCWSESLLLGPMAMRAMSLSEVLELRGLFGQTGRGAEALNGPPARELVPAGKARRWLGGNGKAAAARRAA